MFGATMITILFIIGSALVAVIIRKIKKDKCLKDFRNNIVTLELINGLTGLLEDYIGQRVIFELKKGNEWFKYK